MRLRNVKNKQQIMEQSPYLIRNPKDYFGKWNEIFEKKSPIHIEIGMGKGNFIIQKAINYPDINFVGIEKYDSVIARALEKIPDDLVNLKMIRMNALEIDEVFDHEIDIIYLNFSDPWPKSRQVKRRLTSYVFLEKYDYIFKSNAKIIQKTDNTHLFEYSLVSFSNYGYILSDVCFDLHNLEEEDNIMTEYEEKFSEKGIKIHRLVATRKVSKE